MPRRMPRFDRKLNAVAKAAMAITRAGELSRICSDKKTRAQWSPSKIEGLYELAFLRVFAAWEICLEGIFYRSVCGWTFASRQETPASGSYFSSLTLAETEVPKQCHGKNATYLLWYNPGEIIKRCNKYIDPKGPTVQAKVLASNQSRLDYL